MNPFALLGLGLALGIRHATDPDHVVAVMAISSRTKRWLPAAKLGAIWGLGHTLTVFVVGTLIIAFNLTVPPRIGLALEFAVALALIGMALVTAGVVAPVALATRRRPGLQHGARLATGALSIAFGLWLAWLIGVVDGLFGAHPSWDPH